MRALQVAESGATPTAGTVADPVASADEVLIRVRAAALNPLDAHIAAGWLISIFEHRYPVVLGRDVAGTIEAIGTDVDDLHVGDEVLGHIPFAPPISSGTVGELAVVPAAFTARKPAELSWAQAAALPLAAGAAVALIDALDPAPNSTVLINGASGAVGRFATQLLTQRGVDVIATSSPASRSRLHDLGATKIVDYTSPQSVTEQVHALHPEGVDALINLAGMTLDTVPIDAVRPGGAVHTLTRTPDAETLTARGLTGGDVLALPSSPVLQQLAEQAATGQLQIDLRTINLDQAAQALQDLNTNNAHGKLVVTLAP